MILLALLGCQAQVWFDTGTLSSPVTVTGVEPFAHQVGQSLGEPVVRFAGDHLLLVVAGQSEGDAGRVYDFDRVQGQPVETKWGPQGMPVGHALALNIGLGAAWVGYGERDGPMYLHRLPWQHPEAVASSVQVGQGDAFDVDVWATEGSTRLLACDVEVVRYLQVDDSLSQIAGETRQSQGGACALEPGKERALVCGPTGCLAYDLTPAFAVTDAGPWSTRNLDALHRHGDALIALAGNDATEYVAGGGQLYDARQPFPDDAVLTNDAVMMGADVDAAGGCPMMGGARRRTRRRRKRRRKRRSRHHRRKRY